MSLPLPAPLDREQLNRLALWTRRNGWCAMGFCGLMALTLVGIPLAIFLFLQGRALLDSADHLDKAAQTGRSADLQQALERASFQFILQVLSSLALVLMVVLVVLFVIWAGFSGLMAHPFAGMDNLTGK